MKVAIFGYTPREEVIVSKLFSQNSQISVDLYTGIKNPALESRVSNVFGVGDADFDHLQNDKPNVILLGPDHFSIAGYKEKLAERGLSAIGSSQEQIKAETDRSYLRNRFPGLRKYFPPYEIINEYDPDKIASILNNYSEYAVKYNGVYPQIGGGTKISGIHLQSHNEALAYIKSSIDECGKVVVEKKIDGIDFSVNAISAKDGSVFFFPENYCYKLRNDGNTGPNTSGTGSFAFADVLPFLNEQNREDARRITCEVVDHMNSISDVPFVSGLNLDFRVDNNQQIHLFEVNARFAGSGTLSTVMDLCDNNLFDILNQSQNGTFKNMSFKKKNDCSVGVFTFPSFFPLGDDSDIRVQLPRYAAMPSDINCYTGWIDARDETEKSYDAFLKNSTTLLLQTSGKTIEDCRNRVYGEMAKLPSDLEYRKDVGDLSVNFLKRLTH